jgi:hypothetical protein
LNPLTHSLAEPLQTRLLPEEVGFDGNSNQNLARLARMLQVAYGALGFAERHGFETYDTMDFKGTQILLWTYTKGTPLARLVRLALFGGVYLAPIGMRKLLGVKPSRFPYASAMLASAYLELSNLTSEDLWIVRAKSLLQWLAQHAAESPVGESWGFPFPWFTYAGVIPPTVGNAHGTVWAANAFFSYYEATRDPWGLEHSVRACDFFAYGLNSAERSSGSLAISYTPRDRSQCINVNADAASVLLRVGKAAARPEYRDIARKIVRFVVETQEPDGSWYYDEPVPGVRRVPFIDGFHTAIVLTALTQIISELQDVPDLRKDCESALNRGLAFYLQNLLTPDGRPRYDMRMFYPIDPYSFGQAINTLIDATDCAAVDIQLREKIAALLPKVVDQTLNLMLDSDGSFFSARYRFRIFRLRSLRWAQAVVALAFVRYSRFLLLRLKAPN